MIINNSYEGRVFILLRISIFVLERVECYLRYILEY
jgi:hypothetical protein